MGSTGANRCNKPNGPNDIHRRFHPNTKEYVFFSAPQGIFCKTDHTFGDKTNFNRYKNIKINPTSYGTITD